MKTNNIILTSLVAAALLVFVVGCAMQATRPATDYRIVIDKTDSTITVPDTAEVIADLGVKKDIWQGITFTLSWIEDVSYTRHYTVSLPKGGSRLASNKYERERAVRAFTDALAAKLDSARHNRPGRPRSSVYLALCNELAALANSNTERRVLTIYSDMRENTAAVSFYDPRTIALLTSDPDTIRQKLEAEMPLPKNLTGIEVRIVYSPKNAEDDASFRLASGFFKKMLEDRGAQVTITANLANQ